jgi:hypothetical protein
VKRGTVSGGPYLTIACTADTNYTDTGLVDGAAYYYVVSAAFTGGTDGGGESADSVEASTPMPEGPTTTTTTTLPSCPDVIAEPSRLEPPDHHVVPISIDSVTGNALAVTITGIAQDEPLTRHRNGRCGDAGGVGTATAELRAERRMRGDGRVYHVSFRGDDALGGRCAGMVSVCVPRGPGTACVDQGLRVDSTNPACTGACAERCALARSLAHRVCAGETVPAKLERSILAAEGLLARGPQTAARLRAAIRSIERAMRVDSVAEQSGRISAACGNSIATLLSDTREHTKRLLTVP